MRDTDWNLCSAVQNGHSAPLNGRSTVLNARSAEANKEIKVYPLLFYRISFPFLCHCLSIVTAYRWIKMGNDEKVSFLLV